MMAGMKLYHSERIFYYGKVNFYPDFTWYHNIKGETSKRKQVLPWLKFLRNAVAWTFLLQAKGMTTDNTWVQQVWISHLKPNRLEFSNSAVPGKYRSIHWGKCDSMWQGELLTIWLCNNALPHGCVITRYFWFGFCMPFMRGGVSSIGSQLWHLPTSSCPYYDSSWVSQLW